MCIYICTVYLIPNSLTDFQKKKTEMIIIIIIPPWFFPLIFPHHRHLGQELASYVLTGATGGLGKLGKPNDGPMDDGGLEPLGLCLTPRCFLGVEKNKYPPGN